MPELPPIAFLGIGLMGFPMASNLIEAGYPLTVWNRTRSKAEALSGRARVADSAALAVEGAEVVITMLESGPVVTDVLFGQGVAAAMAAGAVLVDMSSIAPATARQHARDLAANDVAYVDAPVSGGTIGAREGNLTIMAGGKVDVIECVRPLLEVLGRLTRIGPAGSGQLAKLANQAIVGISIGAVAEALLLADRGGADPAAVREALLGGFAGSRILELHGERMLRRDFEPGGKARTQLKDLRMILDEARAGELTLPLAEEAFHAYRSLIAMGEGEVDHSGLLLQLEHLNQVRMGSPNRASYLDGGKDD